MNSAYNSAIIRLESFNAVLSGVSTVMVLFVWAVAVYGLWVEPRLTGQGQKGSYRVPACGNYNFDNTYWLSVRQP